MRLSVSEETPESIIPHDIFSLYPPIKTLHTLKILGESIIAFGSLHNSHAIHCVPRNYTWKVYFFSVLGGVGHYIETCGCLT